MMPLLKTLPFLVVVALGVTPCSATGQNLAGYVAGIAAQPGGAAELRRGADPPRPLRLGENILAGDTVSVRPPTRIRVDTMSGAMVMCTAEPANSACSYRFQASGGRAPSDVLHRLSTVLSWFSAPQSGFAVRDDAAPRLAVAAGIPQYLAAGERELWIAWAGGTAPFRVALLANGIASEATVEGGAARLARRPFLEGPAELRVTDARGLSAALAIAVVPTPVVQSFSGNAVNADHAALLSAAELARREGGRWRLEAAQRAAEVAPRVPAADAFIRALAAGDRLEP